jgi:hypothetical protein
MVVRWCARPSFGFDIAHLGNVFQDDRLVSKQGRSHGRQRGVFRAADAHRSEQRSTAANDKFVHQ